MQMTVTLGLFLGFYLSTSAWSQERSAQSAW